MNAGPPGSARSGLRRLGRRLQKARDIAFYSLLRAGARIAGIKPRHGAEDRRLLDQRILPALAEDARYARVLFVGCDWYTEHVEELFISRGREYATLEIDPARAAHGARRHIVGSLTDLDSWFPAGSLDLIVCNGVIGWGLNDPSEVETSIEACAHALTSGGLLLLGWDDVPEKLPVPIEQIRALHAFRKTTPRGLEGPVIRTGTYTNHTFGFFAKAGGEPG